MKLSMMTHIGLGALLLAAGLTLASAEELVGTPVPLGEGVSIHSDRAAPDAPESISAIPDMPPPAHPEWHQEIDKDLKDAFADFNHHQDMDGGYDDHFEPAVLIPILGVIFIFGGPLILVGFFITQRYRARAMRQESLNLNIDKLLAAGRDIPVEILRGDEPQRPDESGNRDKGVRNVFLGTGWLIFLTIFFGIDIGAAGFIWIALGLSQLVIWKLNNPTTNTQPQAGQQD